MLLNFKRLNLSCAHFVFYVESDSENLQRKARERRVDNFVLEIAVGYEIGVLNIKTNEVGINKSGPWPNG